MDKTQTEHNPQQTAQGTAQPQCLDLDTLYGSRFRLGWEADGKTRHLWPRDEQLRRHRFERFDDRGRTRDWSTRSTRDPSNTP
jgi:hypothetical protein